MIWGGFSSRGGQELPKAAKIPHIFLLSGNSERNSSAWDCLHHNRLCFASKISRATLIISPSCTGDAQKIDRRKLRPFGILALWLANVRFSDLDEMLTSGQQPASTLIANSSNRDQEISDRRARPINC